MGSGHAHTHIDAPAPARSRRLLLIVLTPLLLATVVGLAVLWPSPQPAGTEGIDLGFDVEPTDGTVLGERMAPCASVPDGSGATCRFFDVRLDEGPDEGSTFALELQDSPTSVDLEPGDEIVLGRALGDGIPEDLRYSFFDFQRRDPLLLLAALFVAAVLALGRWHGLRALAGLGISLFVLVRFVLPSILDGNDAVAVSLVGSAVIMLVALYLSHGFSDRTTTAVVGTLVSLGLTGVLAVVFIGLTSLTGLADEDARILQLASASIDLRGLILGGIIIGTLGVLDDVTVTQVSAVWELHHANPSLGRRGLSSAALRIGRDHIASTVNTLVLAYAGASLPLLVLFVEARRGLGEVLTGETIATELVRTLVGSIGLVASVPVTTFLAAVVVTGRAGWESRRAADYRPRR
ncbi:MAG TPA: YibE/F family protein [Acidimicrobiales bacterium]|nr:YibE/F family protein [Acidimicrobiales bacterium]